MKTATLEKSQLHVGQQAIVVLVAYLEHARKSLLALVGELAAKCFIVSGLSSYELICYFLSHPYRCSSTAEIEIKVFQTSCPFLVFYIPLATYRCRRMKDCLLREVEHFRDILKVPGRALDTRLDLFVLVHYREHRLHRRVIH